jgi:hypothetical protein
MGEVIAFAPRHRFSTNIQPSPFSQKVRFIHNAARSDNEALLITALA